MEELMVIAIRQFKREHKNSEIRTCAVWESAGFRGKIVSAMFHIEYVDIDDLEGEYKSVDIDVRKTKRKCDMTKEEAIESAGDECNLIGEEVNIYEVIYRYKALRELSYEEREDVYDQIAKRLGFMY